MGETPRKGVEETLVRAKPPATRGIGTAERAATQRKNKPLKLEGTFKAKHSLCAGADNS